MSQFDVVVIGLGAIGSSALYALAGSEARVIGIDRFNPPHAFGSSHGETRITRQAIGEGPVYVPLVVRSNEILDVLGSEFGEPLIERCGFLLIARNDATTSCHGKPGFLATTLAAAEKFAIPHECLTSSEVVARFPQFAGLRWRRGSLLRAGWRLCASRADHRRLAIRGQSARGNYQDWGPGPFDRARGQRLPH